MLVVAKYAHSKNVTFTDKTVCKKRAKHVSVSKITQKSLILFNLRFAFPGIVFDIIKDIVHKLYF